MKTGKSGYALPGYWPPDEASSKVLEWIAFFSSRRDYLANETARRTNLWKAS